jgi:hypothetical protein
MIGVNIVVVGTSTGASSNLDGDYFILNLPPGTYDLRASAVGYTPSSVTNVRVLVDQTSHVDFSLQEQSVQMNDIVVTASRPIVQKDLTSTVSSMTSDQISSLPLEDVASVVNLQAGVVDGHFRGGRSSEVKYLIDGVSVNDVYSGAFTMQAEVNSIAEIQVLSGTFNAEYGEALSGIVNQVTKIPGDKYSGELSAYTGDYMTSRTGLFPHINHISPADLHNYQANLSGPVPLMGSLLKFFVSGRYFYDDGYLYGRRIFNPKDSSNFGNNDPSKWYVGATGDSAYVPMNFQKRFSMQGKLEINVGTAKGIVLSAMYQKLDYRDYDHSFVLNPDGDYKKFQTSFLGGLNYTQVLSSAAFIDYNSSVYVSDFKQYVYEDPLDPRYVNPVRLQDAGANSFLTGGTQNWHFLHNTNSYTGKIDLTALYGLPDPRR